MTSYQQPSYQPTPTIESDASASDPSMKDKATEAMGQGKQAASEVAQTATEHVQEVKDEAVKQARDLVGEARGHVSQQVGSQHQNLVANLRSLSSELGSMVDRSEQRGTASELVSQARDRVDGVAGWLDGREPADVLDEVRAFARRRPGAFLLGALAAGVVAGRLTRGAVDARSDSTESSGAHAANAPTQYLGAEAGTAGYETGAGYAPTTSNPGYAQTGYEQAGYPQTGYPQTGYEQSYDPANGGGTQPYPSGGYRNGEVGR